MLLMMLLLALHQKAMSAHSGHIDLKNIPTCGKAKTRRDHGSPLDLVGPEGTVFIATVQIALSQVARVLWA